LYVKKYISTERRRSYIDYRDTRLNTLPSCFTCGARLFFSIGDGIICGFMNCVKCEPKFSHVQYILLKRIRSKFTVINRCWDETWLPSSKLLYRFVKNNFETTLFWWLISLWQLISHLCVCVSNLKMLLTIF